MIIVDIKSVVCGHCRMLASLDDAGICENCRNRADNDIPPVWSKNLALMLIAITLVIVGCYIEGSWPPCVPGPCPAAVKGGQH